MRTYEFRASSHSPLLVFVCQTRIRSRMQESWSPRLRLVFQESCGHTRVPPPSRRRTCRGRCGRPSLATCLTLCRTTEERPCTRLCDGCRRRLSPPGAAGAVFVAVAAVVAVVVGAVSLLPPLRSLLRGGGDSTGSHGKKISVTVLGHSVNIFISQCK